MNSFAIQIALFIWLLASGAPSCIGGVSPRADETRVGYATFYTAESSRREGTSGTHTASGRRYDESAMTCALPAATRKAWNMRFGDPVRVTNLANGHTVTVRCTDTGPGQKAQARKVIVDLTPAAFEKLGGRLKDGRLKVSLEK